LEFKLRDELESDFTHQKKAKHKLIIHISIIISFPSWCRLDVWFRSWVSSWGS